MAKPPPVQRIAGHERLGQEVQGRAVDDHARAAHGVDHRPAGGVAQHVDLAALGAVEEGLAHVAVDDQLAALGDLAELVLGVAVDVDLQPVHAGAQVIARVVVAVDPQAVGRRAEADGVEPRAAAVVVNDVPPAEVEGPDRQGRVAVVAFGGEAAGVDQQRASRRPAGRAAGRACPR